jgi:hypothetical protein
MEWCAFDYGLRQGFQQLGIDGDFRSATETLAIDPQRLEKLIDMRHIRQLRQLHLSLRDQTRR